MVDIVEYHNVELEDSEITVQSVRYSWLFKIIFIKRYNNKKELYYYNYKDANVEINDYGNDLNAINKFANHLNIEINITESEQFNKIIYTANKGFEDKIYLYKTRNHFDVIKSMTAFYNVAYYCHEC